MRHPYRCEVCHRHEKKKHSTNNREETVIVVGRKPNGTSRILCGREYCAQKWAREKDKRMALWPENVEAAKLLKAADDVKLPPIIKPTTVLKGVLVTHVGQKRIEALHGPPGKLAAVITHKPVTLYEGDTVTIQEAPLPKTHSPIRNSYPAELYTFARAYLDEHGYRIGTATSLYERVKKDHVAWITRSDNSLVTAPAFGSWLSMAAGRMGYPNLRGSMRGVDVRVAPKLPPPFHPRRK